MNSRGWCDGLAEGRAAERRHRGTCGDLRDPETILTAARRTLDFDRPIAVLLLAILHFIPDGDDPYGIVKKLMDAVPPGSFLVICHAPSDIQPDQVAEMTRRYNESDVSAQMRARSREEITAFFTGLEMIGPGVVPIAEWLRPDQADPATSISLAGYVGVARKPAKSRLR